jgi:hypothetical protein
MSKKKIVLISLAAAMLFGSLAAAIPAFAAVPAAGIQLNRNTTLPNRNKVLLRLLLVQDEAKVDSIIAQGVSSGKLTADQGAKVKDFWTEHHAQFTKNLILRRLLTAKDESKVKAFLEKAVQAGKIQQPQADKIIQMWEILHSSAPATAA